MEYTTSLQAYHAEVKAYSILHNCPYRQAQKAVSMQRKAKQIQEIRELYLNLLLTDENPNMELIDSVEKDLQKEKDAIDSSLRKIKAFREKKFVKPIVEPETEKKYGQDDEYVSKRLGSFDYCKVLGESVVKELIAIPFNGTVYTPKGGSPFVCRTDISFKKGSTENRVYLSDITKNVEKAKEFLELYSKRVTIGGVFDLKEEWGSYLFKGREILEIVGLAAFEYQRLTVRTEKGTKMKLDILSIFIKDMPNQYLLQITGEGWEVEGKKIYPPKRQLMDEEEYKEFCRYEFNERVRKAKIKEQLEVA